MPTRFIVMLIVLVFAASCAEIPRGYAAREWSLALREMQIVPVFPPREDVQIGDVYLVTADEMQTLESVDTASGKSGFLPIGVQLDHVNLNTQLAAYYNARAAFPATVLDRTDLTSAPQPTNPAGVWTGGDATRLRLVGFPEFLSATYSKGDLSALIPVEAVQVGLAAGFTKNKKVKVSIPVAESCGLPVATVLARYQAADGRKTHVDDLAKKMFAPLMSDSTKGQAVGYIRLITEVYYARVIDVSVYDSKSRGGQLNVKLPVPEGLPAARSGAGAGAGGGAAGGDATPTSTEVSMTPQQAAEELNKQLAASLASSTPGVNLKFVSAAEGSVSLRRTYERPIAIGYRGVVFPIVHVEDVRSAGLAIGSPMPEGRGFLALGGDTSLIPINKGDPADADPAPAIPTRR